jgi:CMP-N,N'-diacetyllegionaminic acid synthase
MSFTKDDVICIICARGGSKGLPRKNVKLLDGLPLVARPILQAIESGVIGTVLVSTDDIEIAEIAKKYGASVPFLRPSELAQDITTTEDTLKQALIAYEELVNKKFEIAVFLTPTDVFRDSYLVKEVVEMLRNKPELESVFSGHATHKNFWEKDNDGKWVRLRPWMSNYSSRQVRQTVVREDTGIACASRAWLWREGRRIGDKVDIILNDNDFTSIDIHEQKDLQLAEYALKLLKKE